VYTPRTEHEIRADWGLPPLEEEEVRPPNRPNINGAADDWELGHLEVIPSYIYWDMDRREGHQNENLQEDEYLTPSTLSEEVSAEESKLTENE